MTLNAPTLYTVGHSNRSIQEFIDLLVVADIQTLVDVRRVPRSGRYPQFSEPQLRVAINGAGMAYHWAGRQLGGHREGSPDSPHTALHGAYRGYADHMETDVFEKAAAQLVSVAFQGRTAVMCAEREPDHCHRALLADYLTLRGLTVLHLIARDEVREHRLNPALRTESVRPVYDRGTTGTLDFDS